jgi:hypothetical protein
VIGTDRWRSEPPCVYPPAKRRVGVEYSLSILEPVRPGAVSPHRALFLPTFSHFVIVNKTSLSLSLEQGSSGSSKSQIAKRVRASPKEGSSLGSPKEGSSLGLARTFSTHRLF